GASGGWLVELGTRSGGSVLRLATPDAWWRRVSDATWPVEPTSSLTLRIGSRPTDVVKALRTLEAAAGSAGLGLRATGELANGVLHVLLTGPAVTEAAALVGRVRTELAPMEATCVVEHVPLSVKPRLDVWGDI